MAKTPGKAHTNGARPQLGSPATVSNEVEMLTRTMLAQLAGVTFGGVRDVYAALGHTRQPSEQLYYDRFERQGMARRIVKALPEECWGKPPRITESREVETPFEKAWTEIETSVGIWDLMLRADIRSRIGHYGVLFLGFDDDATDLTKPVDKANKLLYGMPFSSISARIRTWEKDPQNPRYGLPETYTITFRSMAAGATDVRQKGIQKAVHWTRVIHFADELGEDNVFATPALEPVLNDLEDLEKVIGGGAEGYWRNAFPGLLLNLAENASSTPEKLAAMREQIEDYVHGYQRIMRLQGVEPHELIPQLADPTGMVAVIVDQVSAATNIPKRKLVGAEAGQLASSQDEDSWLSFANNRRIVYCEKKVRELIDRLGMVGVLKVPLKYTVDWPPLVAKNEATTATIGQAKAGAIATYANSPSAPELVAPEMFLRVIIGMTDEEIEENAKMVEQVTRETEELERRLQELLGQAPVPELPAGEEQPEEEIDEEADPVRVEERGA